MEPVKLKIPRGLALEIAADKAARKSIGSWLVLKAIGDGGQAGPITTDMAAACRCCVKTMRKRIAYMVQNGLAYFDGQQNVRLAAWSKLNELYNLAGRCRHITLSENEKCKPEHLLMTLAIDEKKKECAAAAKYKMDKIPMLKDKLKTILSVKYIDKKTLTECQLKSYFTHRTYDEEETDIIKAVRMDDEVGYKRWSNIIGYKGRGSFAYLKRKLQALGLLKVIKRSFFNPDAWHLSTRSRREATKLGTHYYSRPKKAVILTLPDSLEVTF